MRDFDRLLARAGQPKTCSTKMGLENRSGTPCYYRKERIGQRVVSRYLGSGLIAKLYAERAEQESREKAVKKAKERATIKASEDEEAAFDVINGMVESVTKASLLAAGFHAHKREWRLIRGGKK